MGGQPCFWKALHDGARIKREAKALVKFLERDDVEIPDDDTGYGIVDQLIIAENALGVAHRMALESNGWHGPWPHYLDIKEKE